MTAHRATSSFPNGDNAPATGGDNSEATADHRAHLKHQHWGADNFDATDLYSAATGFTQDGVGRSLTFTNNTVAVSGEKGTALTSHGDLVTFSVINNGTEIIGQASHNGGTPRTVIEITLSDDGTCDFHVVLHGPPLDHAAQRPRTRTTSFSNFNYTATEFRRRRRARQLQRRRQ